MTKETPFIVLTFDGKHYKYRMSLNSIIELQERTGVNLEDPLAMAEKIKGDLKFIRIIMYLGIKTYDKEITEEEVGDMIDVVNFEDILDKVFTHLGMAPEKEDGEGKNAQRVLTKKIPSRGTGKRPYKRPVKSKSPLSNSTTKR